jgi:threonine dehydrogenase-like Zn-dependent dehydrogenase
MRALWMEDGRLSLIDAPVPRRPGDCLIRVTLAGICGTDLHMRRGYADYTGIPGHEFVGIVEETPDGQHAWLGRRVVGEINIGCGTCGPCARGVKEHCERRDVLGIRGRHGTLAEYLGLDARPTPDGPLPPAERFDVVVELTGRGDGLERALGCVRPLGTIVMKTTAHGAPPLATWPIVVDEVTVIGSRCGPFEPALALLASGVVRTAPLVEDVFTLDQFDAAFSRAERGLKVLVRTAR